MSYPATVITDAVHLAGIFEDGVILVPSDAQAELARIALGRLYPELAASGRIAVQVDASVSEAVFCHETGEMNDSDSEVPGDKTRGD